MISFVVGIDLLPEPDTKEPKKVDIYGHITNSYVFRFNNLSFLPAENSRTFQRFLNLIFPRCLNPNPLPILMRAVNTLKLHGIIHQPCWRAARWKSKT